MRQPPELRIKQHYQVASPAKTNEIVSSVADLFVEFLKRSEAEAPALQQRARRSRSCPPKRVVSPDAERVDQWPGGPDGE